MSSFTLEATVRDNSGKGAARRTRMTGLVPAVVYGPGKQALTVAVDPRHLAKALTGSHKRNALINLSLKDASGKAQGNRTVVVKDLQQHVVRRTPTHVDFLEVALDRAITFKVPLEATGKSKAAADGGKTTLVVRTINVLAKPTDVPEKIGFDVTDQGFGVVRAKQLTMPAGSTLLDPAEMPIISVRIPRQEKEEEVAATAAPGAEGAAVPGAEGAAAPAAGAKPAAGAAAAPAGDAKAEKKK